MPASEYRALQHQVRELQRLLGKKTLENEILRDARWTWCSQKTAVAITLAGTGRHAVKTIADTLGIARSNLMVQTRCERSRQRRGRRPRPEGELVAEIKGLIAGQVTYGYRRIHGLLRRQRREQGGAAANVKRVYRVMKAHGLLLDRYTGSGKGTAA